MPTVEQLNLIISHLKQSMDYLMIRVSSCEQFIEKLFKLVGEASNGHQKFSSLDQINCSDPTSPDKQSNRKATKKKSEESRQSPIIIQTQRDKKTHLTSLNNFLLLPSSKQTRSKQLQTGSLTLMKNAILVNMHEIEKLQENCATIRNQYQTKFNKSNEAIELLTKVMGLMQEKIQNIMRVFANINPVTGRSNSKNKSLGKSRRNKGSGHQYISI